MSMNHLSFFPVMCKGLLLAWTMRFMPLWNKFSSEFIDIIQGAVRAFFQQQKICWIRGLSYTLLAKEMVVIHIAVHIHLLILLLCIYI